MTKPLRSLSLLDCLAIGINGIVGSGVYLLIGRLAGLAGSVSVVGMLACGVLFMLIALCFAELGGMFDRNGGVYVYAREAFGPQVGFVIGWLAVVTGVFAFALVGAGFGEALVRFLPGLSKELFSLGGHVFTGRPLVSMALIAVLGLINYFGVKAGARTLDLLSVAKLLPLIAVVLVGLLAVRGEVLAGIFSAPPGKGYGDAVAYSTLTAVLLYAGFEYTAVPAGEVKDARRNVPLAIVGSLLGAIVLYGAIQVVALSTVPDLPGHEQPLMEVAAVLFGDAGRTALGVAALISMAGFCAGSALVGPRYFAALARDGYLPRVLTATSRFQTPGPATFVSTSLSALLALYFGFSSLVDISNVVLVLQYLAAPLALIALRIRRPDAERTFRIPGGVAVATLAAVAVLILLYAARPSLETWVFAGQILAVGILTWGVTLVARRLSARGDRPAPAVPGEPG